MTHEIFSAPMLLTENIIDKARLRIEVSSFSQIRVFSSGLGVQWWAAAFVYEVDRYRLHLNHGIQGWVLNSGSEQAPWRCLDYVWRGDTEAPLPPRALCELWLPWAMSDGAGTHSWCSPRGPWGAARERTTACTSTRKLPCPAALVHEEWESTIFHSLFSVLLLCLKCSPFFETHIEQQLD